MFHPAMEMDTMAARMAADLETTLLLITGMAFPPCMAIWSRFPFMLDKQFLRDK